MPTLLIDQAWTRADPAAIKAAGYSGVIGYFSTDASKNLTAAYVQACIAAGLTIDAVWEVSGTDALTGGFQAGVSDAQQANDQADAIAMPATATIYYAVDTQATADQVRAYFQGCDSVGRRPVGAYGDIAVTDPLKADGTVKHTWQTAAWSGGQVSATADLYQRVTPTQPQVAGVAAGAYDEDVVLPAGVPDYGQWPSPQGAPVAAPAYIPPNDPSVIPPGQITRITDPWVGIDPVFQEPAWHIFMVTSDGKGWHKWWLQKDGAHLEQV